MWVCDLGTDLVTALTFTMSPLSQDLHTTPDTLHLTAAAAAAVAAGAAAASTTETACSKLTGPLLCPCVRCILRPYATDLLDAKLLKTLVAERNS